MLEYDFFDGDHFITLDIVEVNDDKNEVTLAISEQGRITQTEYLLFGDATDDRYFEFGLYADRIYLSDFELLGRENL